MSASAAPTSAPSSPGLWPELDVLRGLAVVAMVLNHAVAGWHSGEHPFSPVANTLFFIGGFAPVLFFFATGFGVGLQSLRQASPGGDHRYGFGRKVAILLLADQFIPWRYGPWSGIEYYGLDFLGFIAISTVVLRPLRRLPHATAVALIGAALVLVVRFGISPWLVPDVHADPAAEFFARWTGRAATPGFAYPPLPWLLYPLLGFVLGRVAGVQRSFLERNSLVFSAALAATALAGSAAGWAFSNAGWDITRYGVHALGFLPLALASIAAAAALSWLLGRARADGSASAHALERGLAMRGVSSLIVVPMHFAAVYSLGLHLLPAPSDSALIAAGIATTMACMLAGRGFGRFAERVERGGNGRAAWIAASVIAAAMTLVLWWLPAHGPHTRHAAAFVAQICLCGLLVWSPGRRTREAS